MKKLAALLLLSVSGSTFAAGPTYTTQTTNVEVVIPSHMSVDGQVYSFDAKGMRSYLEVLEADGQDEFADKLRPKVDELEAKTSSAKTALYVGGGIGLAFIVYAAVLPEEKVEHVTAVPGDFSSQVEANIENGERDVEASGRHLNKQMTLGAIGIAAIGIGYGLNKLLQPDREELMGFVNLHNRKAKQYKIPKIEMNLGESMKSIKTFSLAWSF